MATIDSIDSPQEESNSTTSSKSVIEKHVPITVTCTVEYQTGTHGLMSLYSEETVQVSGVALIVRKSRGACASTTEITGFSLPVIGPCRLCQPRVPLQG